jgi:hypothetical protein
MAVEHDQVYITAAYMNGDAMAAFVFYVHGTVAELKRQIEILAGFDSNTYEIGRLQLGEAQLTNAQTLFEVGVRPKGEALVIMQIQERLPKVKTWTGFVTAQDYELSFEIMVHKSGVWGSIVHFTDCNDKGMYGSRIPRICLAPSSTKLCVACGHTKNWDANDWTRTLTPGLAYDVRVRCEGNTMNVFLNNELVIDQESGERPSRTVEVHFGGSRAGGLRTETANAAICNMTYRNLRTGQLRQLSNPTWVELSDFTDEVPFGKLPRAVSGMQS